MNGQAANARYRELARRADKLSEPQFSDFLDPFEAGQAVQAANQERVQVRFDGGYPDAERRMAAFYSEEAPTLWPIEAVEMKWNPKYGTPEHRDILGALMALGYERDRMGDIILGESRAYVFARPEIARWIAANLDSAGRSALHCSTAEGIVQLPPPKGMLFRETVASVRLDAVLAAGYKLSRSEAQKLIQRGLVRKNFQEELREDAALLENDLISTKGYGRLKLMEIEGETRKGRIAIRLFRYGA